MSPSGELVYSGIAIRARGEMLNLTDMWKAAESPSGRAPNDWRALPGTDRFIEHVASTLDAGKSGNQVIQVRRGGRGVGGATLGHWQIGLAYAKYLSPAFHVWCNTVVRAHMEGRLVAAQATPPAPSALVLTPDLRQAIGGIVKGVVNKALDEQMTSVVENAIARALQKHMPDLAGESAARDALRRPDELGTLVRSMLNKRNALMWVWAAHAPNEKTARSYVRQIEEIERTIMTMPATPAVLSAQASLLLELLLNEECATERQVDLARAINSGAAKLVA